MGKLNLLNILPLKTYTMTQNLIKVYINSNTKKQQFIILNDIAQHSKNKFTKFTCRYMFK